MAGTLPAITVNTTDLVWIWQGGQLLRTTVGALVAATVVPIANSSLATAANLTLKSNISGGVASPSDNTLSSILDAIFGSTQGALITRGASGWTVIPAGSVGQLLTGTGAGSAPTYQALAVALSNLPTQASGTVLSNISGGSAVPSANNISGVIDTLGATRGSILYRGAAGWTILTPGTNGQALTSSGPGADPTYTTLPGSGTVTSVGVSGGSTGLSFTGAISTSGTITASGTLVVANGGTGATTIPGAQQALGFGFLVNQAVTANATSLAINYALGGDVSLTLSSNVSVAFTISNWPAAGQFGRIILEIASTGAYNITVWPGTTIWNGGAAPTITSGNGSKDTIILTSNDGGVNFRGYVASQAMA